MKNRVITSLMYFLLICSMRVSVCGQTSETHLERKFFSEDHHADTYRALALASDQNREDLLLLALDNPDPRIREEAARRICTLAGHSTIDAYVTILQKDSLWIEEANGSTNVTMQWQFVEDIKNRLHLDITNTNLFDSHARSDLVVQMRKRSILSNDLGGKGDRHLFHRSDPTKKMPVPFIPDAFIQKSY